MKTRVAVVAAVAGLSFCARAEIHLTPPSGANFDPEVVCGHCPNGWTRLLDLTLRQGADLPAEFVSGLGDRINEQFHTRNRWRCELNTGVSGELTVNAYKAYDLPACDHGAEFRADLTITGGLPAGQQFAWMQFFSWSGDANETWIVDPREYAHIGDGAMDGYPFYYNYLDLNPDFEVILPEFFQNPDTGSYGFRDFPGISGGPINDPSYHAGRFSANLFLVSWDGVYDPFPMTSETIQVFGQLSWGFEYSCVPSPGTGVMVAAALWIVLRRRR